MPLAPELIVLMLNGVLLIVSYSWLYPKYVADNIRKLMINDVVASVVALAVAGGLFMGKNISFNALLFDANWFWFTLLSYFVLEIPFSVRYCNKYNLWNKM
ncbi:hypothetical protein GCM10011369_12290 [Neiella marina]|uniref:Uncharacterized protein n=1 Tax=Neiella marina TaxID=508461 RepID=A0A8J2U3Z6_9GAMM|nr:hypothetical protein [Neiella marina]GGA72080.1 hypothetical protein GCM10011369_12290 [Neiella marina]